MTEIAAATVDGTAGMIVLTGRITRSIDDRSSAVVIVHRNLLAVMTMASRDTVLMVFVTGTRRVHVRMRMRQHDNPS